MFEKITVPGLSDDENATANRLLKQLDAKRPRNVLRQSYYEMKRAVRQVGAIVPGHYFQMGITLGWNAKGVDGLRNRCNLRGFSWSDGDLGSLGLDEFVDDNRLLSELSSGQTASLIHGPSFLVNTRGMEGEPASLLHVRSAMVATGDYNWRTRRMDSLISVLDTDGDGRVSEFALYLPNLTLACVKDGGAWTARRQPHSWGVPVEVMRYKPRDSRLYGVSRITRTTMALQDSAVRALIRMEGHMDVYSWPEMWLLGADMSVFKNPDGSLKTPMSVMLGRIKGVPDDNEAENPRADVKQFPAQSPKPHLEQMNALAKLVAREFNLPDSSFSMTDYANPTSPDAYVEGRDDLIADAEVAMDEWSVSIRRAVRRGLAMQNRDAGLFDELRGLSALWRSPLHLSRAAEADAGMKTVTALPWLAETEVGMELMGLTDDQIKRAQAEQRRAAGRNVLASLTGARVDVGE